MMGLRSRLLFCFGTMLYFTASSHGLRCWSCENMDVYKCIKFGKMQQCDKDEKTCQTEVTVLERVNEYFGRAMPKSIITRTGCKQVKACENNERQNKGAAATETQCKPGKIGSVCRCCCNGYPCNRIRRNLLCMAKKPRKNILNDVFPGLIKAKMERTCPDYPAAPKHGNRTCIGGLSFRSYCKFTCDEGATMVGGDMSICVQRGKDYVWNRPAPKCVRNDMCQKMPDDPKFGMKECDRDGEIGTVCSFACRIGFTLKGSSRTTCVQNSAIPEWTDKTPVCIPFCDMSKVPIPENGNRHCLGEGKIGTTCMFRCNEGYKTDGWWVSRCSSTRNGGRWSHSPPKCLAFCPNRLKAPKQGHMTCSGNGVTGTTCSFSCEENYRIVGAEEAVCVAVDNGAIWSQEPPTCEPICVSEPPSPSYGKVKCSGRQLGDECTFQCHEGFSLVGRGSTSCVKLMESAMWSNESPVCEPVCNDMPPAVPENGNVTCDGNGQLGTVCEYECDIGFRVQGTDAVECVKANEEEAMWSSIPPICIPICHVMPETPEFGQVVCNGEGDIGTTCDFMCDEEYEMYGTDKVMCQEYGDRAEWSNEAPICKPIPRCEPAKDPQDGHVTCNGTGQIGTKCFFFCDTYYRREGDESAVCVRDGDEAYWSKKAVSCKEIEPECAPMGDIVHGKVVCDSDVLRKGAKCQFQCTEPGYELLSDNGGDVTCEGQKRKLSWSSKKPCCVECQNIKKDIIIAMDSSGSIGPAAWNNMTKFVQNIIRKFNVSANDVQFSVFQFSSAARSEGWMYFGRYKKDALIRQVGKMNRMASGTRTGEALKYAEKRLRDRKNRKNVADMIWVLTDGETEDMAEMLKVSKKLRTKGVEILALAISPTENFMDQMTKLTGSKDRVMKAKDMKSLSDDLVSRIAVKICQESCPA